MFEKFFDYLGFATPFIVFFYLILLEKLKSNKKWRNKENLVLYKYFTRKSHFLFKISFYK